MTDFTDDVPRKPAPPRRRHWCTIVLAVCAVFAMSVFIFGFAVMAVMVVVAKGIFDGLFSSLFSASFFKEIQSFLIMALASLMELFVLFSTGQFFPAIMRLLQLLTSS